MVKVFLHQQGKATEFVELDPAKTAEEFGIECTGAGALVWLENAKESLKPDIILADAGVNEQCHLHVSFCKAIEVKVRYAGATFEHSFPPAVTVGPVFKWATGPEALKLDDSENAKHELVVCGTDIDVDEAEHIGFYADEDCSVCFDLRPKERFEG